MDKAFARWPISQSFELPKEFSLLKSLISYSKNLDKFQNFLNYKNVQLLDNLPEANFLINEFNSTNIISLSTENNYKTLLKAILLNDLIISRLHQFCNTQRIILFFNQFNDNKNPISDSWLLKASKLSQKYPLDFCISIPEFTALDIISLFVNPLTKKQGVILNGAPQLLIDSFYNLIKTAPDQISSEIFKIIKEYIRNSFPDIFDKYLKTIDNFYNFMLIIRNNNIYFDNYNIINIYIASYISEKIISEPTKINLDFSDIENLDFNNFISYINQNPLKGFYICQYPETQNYFTKICELHQNDPSKNKKLPLSLFEFRIFVKFYQVQFVGSFNGISYLQDLPNIITTEIQRKIGNWNFQLSHLIGFLLEKVPPFLKDPFHSEYVRNFIINMISTPKSEIIKREIFNYIKQILPSIIDMIGDPDWIQNINKELVYDDSNNTFSGLFRISSLSSTNNINIVNLLSNPWRYVLQNVYEKIRPGFINQITDINNTFISIQNIIQYFTSKDTIEKLNRCIINDLTSFKNKQKNQALIELQKNVVTEDDIRKKKIECSQYIKVFYDSIDQLPIFNMSHDNVPLESKYFYDEFYDFISEREYNMKCISQECEIIIAIIPNRSNPNYVRTLTYRYGRSRVHVCFKTKGNVMLFRPPDFCSLDSLNIQSKTDDCRFLLVNFIHNVNYIFRYSVSSLQSSYNELRYYLSKINEKQLYERRYLTILNQIDQTQIRFGNNDLIGFIQNIINFKQVFESKNIDISEKTNFVINFCEKMRTMTDIKFLTLGLTTSLTDIPFETDQFIKSKINSSKINLYIRRFDYCDLLVKDQRYQELDNLYENCLNLTLKPIDTKYDMNTINDDELQNKSSSFVFPVIFIEKNSLKVTTKSINVKCDPLILGVDLQPFQMKFINSTNDEIICEFQQNNNDLPLPTYKNDVGCLIIEIQIENLIKNTSSVDIEFKFEGKILLKTKSNPNLSTEIEYSITLHFIELTLFFIMKNGHYFAVNNDKVEIVPFSIDSNSKLIIEKFYNQKIYKSEFKDKITQFKNDDLIAPNFKVDQNMSNKQFLNIVADFSNITKYRPNISMNFEFELPNEKSLIAPFQAPMISPMTLAIYSDESKNFEKENVIINIGNLTRKVYFIIEAFNNDMENIAKITNVKIKSNDNDDLIYHNFNPNKNNNSIQPSKFGYIICFFETRYRGPSQIQSDNCIDCSLIVEFQGQKQTINFKYKIQTIQVINKLNVKCAGNNLYYYNFSDKTFVAFDNNIQEINIYATSSFKTHENLILVSPFSYSIFHKKNSIPKVTYDDNKGVISKISNVKICEVFGFILDHSLNQFTTMRINPNLLYNNNNTKNVYLFARIIDKPKSFFSLFCPIKDKNVQFDLLNNDIKLESIFSYFVNFFMGLLNINDLKNKTICTDKTLHLLLKSLRFENNSNSFAYFIQFIGKKRKTIRFRRVVKSIVKFTNCYEIEDNFNQIVNKYGKTSKDVSFYAFISVLNELINDRYNHFQENNFCIQFPIDFNIIKKQQKIILNEQIKENKIPFCKYAIDSLSKMTLLNEIEHKKAKELKKNGFIITKILKWTMKNGIESSNIDELKAYKKIKPKSFINDVKTTNIEIKKCNLLDFPEKITITSFYSKFKEIFDQLQYSRYMIDSNMKHQIHALFFWLTKSSNCFPFYSLKSNFIELITSIPSSFLPYDILFLLPLDNILNKKDNNFEFIQTPKLGYNKNDVNDSNDNYNESNDDEIDDLNNEIDEINDSDSDDYKSSKDDKNKISNVKNEDAENKKKDDEDDELNDEIEKVDDEDDDEYDENDITDAIEKVDNDDEYDENDITDSIEKVDNDEENNDDDDDDVPNKKEDEVEEEDIYDADQDCSTEDEDINDANNDSNRNVDKNEDEDDFFEEDFEEEEDFPTYDYNVYQKKVFFKI